MATERQPIPEQGQPQGEGLPIGHPGEAPFVTKARLEILRDASNVMTPTRPETPVTPFPSPGRVEPGTEHKTRRGGRGGGKSHLKRNLALLGGAATLALGAGVGISKILNHNDNSPVGQTETVKNFPIALTPSDFTPISKEAEKELWNNTKTVDLENNTFTIGFPIDLGSTSGSSEIQTSAYLEPAKYTNLSADRLAELKQNGFVNVNIIRGYQKGAKIPLVYDNTKLDASVILLTEFGKGDFNPAYTSFRIFLKDKATGKTHQTTMGILYGRPLLDNFAKYPKDHSPVYEDGTPIASHFNLAELTTDLQDPNPQDTAFPWQKGQISIDSVGLLNLAYLKSPDGTIPTSQ